MEKRPLGYVSKRCRGLVKNTVKLNTLFALAHLWMVRESRDLNAPEMYKAGGMNRPVVNFAVD